MFKAELKLHCNNRRQNQTHIHRWKKERKTDFKNNWPVKKDFACVGRLNKFYKRCWIAKKSICFDLRQQKAHEKQDFGLDQTPWKGYSLSWATGLPMELLQLCRKKYININILIGWCTVTVGEVVDTALSNPLYLQRWKRTACK